MMPSSSVANSAPGAASKGAALKHKRCSPSSVPDFSASMQKLLHDCSRHFLATKANGIPTFVTAMIRLPHAHQLRFRHCATSYRVRFGPDVPLSCAQCGGEPEWAIGKFAQ